MENTSPDLLLILDSTNILTNYSILNCVYLDKYTPFIKQKDLFTLGQHSKIEVLAKLLEVSSDFLNVELKKIAHNFQQDKKINFPINLSLISRKWKKSKDVKKDIIVKSNSTETKSTEGEDPQDNTKQKDNSIIYLYSSAYFSFLNVLSMIFNTFLKIRFFQKKTKKNQN